MNADCQDLILNKTQKIVGGVWFNLSISATICVLLKLGGLGGNT